MTNRHPVFSDSNLLSYLLRNSEAFHRAGITDSTPDPASGAYGRDQSGELNGWIYEEAGALFHAAQPQPSYEEKGSDPLACLDALRLGLTAAVRTEDLRFHGSVETMLRIQSELREEGSELPYPSAHVS